MKMHFAKDAALQHSQGEIWAVKYQMSKHTNVETLKIITSRDFQFFKFYLRKTSKSRHFWQKIKNEGCYNHIFCKKCFLLYYLYSMILLNMETKHLLKLNNPSCTIVWHIDLKTNVKISPRWLIFSGI